ncbi:MAG: redoxin domain-containing protein, partial [Bacteroidetes bacterium]|nr:redoxin domain-containing protein [Bacteroidota bacterium]
QYYKSHYWDGITFMDERIIRTPFFLPKLENYYRNIIPQDADSIIKDIDYKLLLARSAPEMFKFLLNWFTDEYINPKYMGQDAVFVHLFEKYHSQGISNWLTAKQLDIITRRAYMQMANLIGEKAADLEMLNTSDKPVSLYNVEADYTVLVFWDPTCGHCKIELPKIDSVYRASWKKNNVKIFAILTENQKAEWLKYIQEHNLEDWTNVYETKEMEAAKAAAGQPGFRQLYDVTMTPTLFLLDKDKRIIVKKLNWEQLNDFLQTKFAASIK